MAGLNLQVCIADVWFRLGFSGPADIALANRWVTAVELYQFVDDGVKHLANTCALFLEWQHSTDTIASWNEILLLKQVFTLHAWLVNSNGVRQFRITNIHALNALDSNWTQTFGPPTRISFDALGVNKAALYPTPLLVYRYNQIAGMVPEDITANPVSQTLLVPTILVDYFSMAMIAGARGKESDSAMPEVAIHLTERMKLYDAVIGHLWGTGR